MTMKSYEDYPRNAAGQRYGSEAEAATPADAPDLIAAWGVDGRAGYVLKSDLHGIEPRTPAEAIALTREQERLGARSIPLFAADGTTRIGEFLVG